MLQSNEILLLRNLIFFINLNRNINKNLYAIQPKVHSLKLVINIRSVHASMNKLANLSK